MHALPSANLNVTSAGISWPVDPDRSAPNTTGDLYDPDGNFRDTNLFANYPHSDHKVVWVDVQISAVPEPCSEALLAGGLAQVAGVARRRR